MARTSSPLLYTVRPDTEPETCYSTLPELSYLIPKIGKLHRHAQFGASQ